MADVLTKKQRSYPDSYRDAADKGQKHQTQNAGA
jgi:hypothetical protein